MQAYLIELAKKIAIQLATNKKLRSKIITIVSTLLLLAVMLPTLIVEMAKITVANFFENAIDTVSDFFTGIDDELTIECMQEEKSSVVTFYLLRMGVEDEVVLRIFEDKLVDYDNSRCIYPTRETIADIQSEFGASDSDFKNLYSIIEMREEIERDYTLVVNNGFLAFNNVVTACYGEYAPFGTVSYHYGIDFSPDPKNVLSTPILSYDAGTVIVSEYNSSYGHYVMVNHGEYNTLYAHLAEPSVPNGTRVQKGQQIGIMGTTGYSTGIHLHFEIIKDGQKVNPSRFIQINPNGVQCATN